MAEFRRFDYVAQCDGFAMYVGHFDAHRRLARDAFDQNRFGLQGQTQIIAEAGDAAVFDSGFGLEFKGSDDRTRIDLRTVPTNPEFQALRFDGPSAFLQLAFVHLLAALRGCKEGRRRQFVIGPAVSNLGLRSSRLFLGRRGFIITEFDDGRNPAQKRWRFLFFVFVLFFLILLHDGFFGRYALLWHGRAPGDFYFFHAFAQPVGFFRLTPFPDARHQLAKISIGGHRLFHPLAGGAKRKNGGQKYRGQEGSDRNVVRSQGIDPGAQAIRQHRAEQAARGKGSTNLRHVNQGQLRRERRQQHGRTDHLGDRGFQQLAAKPAHGHHKHSNREEERRESAELKESVGHVRADRTNPVARWGTARRRRRNVERRIVRRIRKQAEREQDGETQADEADHFVESLIVRRCKDPHDDFPFLP